VFVESVSAHAVKSRAAGTKPRPSRPGSVLPGLEGLGVTTARALAQFAPRPPDEIPQLTGRTGGDLIVCFDGAPDLVGRIVDVRISRAAPLALFGSL
jgi:hypothetical protein